MPPNSRELLAFVFFVLVEIDNKEIAFGEFINKYFFEDGSFSSGYASFINAMIKPFKNSVKILMENVIEGKLQDPVEALTEEENRRAKEKEEQEKALAKEAEGEKRIYSASVRTVKRILLDDKKKIKDSKLKVVYFN